MVQWLKLHASTTATTGLIPSWGTKILHATQHSEKNKLNNYETSGKMLEKTGLVIQKSQCHGKNMKYGKKKM